MDHLPSFRPLVFPYTSKFLLYQKVVTSCVLGNIVFLCMLSVGPVCLLWGRRTREGQQSACVCPMCQFIPRLLSQNEGARLKTETRVEMS